MVHGLAHFCIQQERKEKSIRYAIKIIEIENRCQLNF